MKFLTTCLLLLGAVFVSPAQTLLKFSPGCAIDSVASAVDDIYVFAPSKEALAIVKQITDVVGTRPNFEIMSADVENAEAHFDTKKGVRYILYSEEYVHNIVKSTGTKWAIYYVFAHEIAHHYNGDMFKIDDQWHQKEMDADKFAGGILCSLGATFEEVTAATSELTKTTSKYHPKKSARVASVISGWKGKCEGEPVIPGIEPTVREGGQPGEANPCGGKKQRTCFKNVATNWQPLIVILSQKGKEKMRLMVPQGLEECNYDVLPGVYEIAVYLEHEAEELIMRRSQIEIKACDDMPIEVGAK